MGKIAKTFTLSPEIAEKLNREPNQSKLIENSLIQFWGYSSQKIKETKEKINKLQEDLSEMENKRQKYNSAKNKIAEVKKVIVKENEYEKELDNSLSEHAEKNRELYNAVYFKFKEIKNKLKQKELRKECFEKARNKKKLELTLIKEYLTLKKNR